MSHYTKYAIILTMDNKKIIKYKRTKYIRESERFINKSVSFISRDDITKDKFDAFIQKIYASFLEIEKITLYSEYFSLLESTIQKIANLVQNELQIDEVKKIIMYEANQLRKLKRKKSFSRKKFNYKEDWS